MLHALEYSPITFSIYFEFLIMKKSIITGLVTLPFMAGCPSPVGIPSTSQPTLKSSAPESAKATASASPVLSAQGEANIKLRQITQDGSAQITLRVAPTTPSPTATYWGSGSSSTFTPPVSPSATTTPTPSGSVSPTPTSSATATPVPNTTSTPIVPLPSPTATPNLCQMDIANMSANVVLNGTDADFAATTKFNTLNQLQIVLTGAIKATDLVQLYKTSNTGGNFTANTVENGKATFLYNSTAAVNTKNTHVEFAIKLNGVYTNGAIKVTGAPKDTLDIGNSSCPN